MKRARQVTLLTASTTIAFVLTAGATWAQGADVTNCRPDVAYRVGSVCYPTGHHANWRGRPAWAVVALNPEARAAAASATGYYGGDYTADAYRPAWGVFPINRAARAATASATGYYGGDYTADAYHPAWGAVAVHPAARAATASATDYYGGDYAADAYHPAWGAVAVHPAARAAAASAIGYYGADYATDVNHSEGWYGGVGNTYLTYPPREVYRHSYVPGAYYGPVCNPRIDILCQ